MLRIREKIYIFERAQERNQIFLTKKAELILNGEESNIKSVNSIERKISIYSDKYKQKLKGREKSNSYIEPEVS